MMEGAIGLVVTSGRVSAMIGLTSVMIGLTSARMSCYE
jgi:hypothetical protein